MESASDPRYLFEAVIHNGYAYCCEDCATVDEEERRENREQAIKLLKHDAAYTKGFALTHPKLIRA
jgi:hypothetical protein